MEKIIRIGNTEKTFRANGATPIKYRRLFKGADFFRDLTAMKSIDLEHMTDADIEGIEKLAYTMCTDSNKPDMNFEDWLSQFELFGLVKAIPEVIELITGDLDTQAIAGSSKNADPAES